MPATMEITTTQTVIALVSYGAQSSGQLGLVFHAYFRMLSVGAYTQLPSCYCPPPSPCPTLIFGLSYKP